MSKKHVLEENACTFKVEIKKMGKQRVRKWSFYKERQGMQYLSEA
jgi:hypothetical protein